LEFRRVLFRSLVGTFLWVIPGASILGASRLTRRRRCNPAGIRSAKRCSRFILAYSCGLDGISAKPACARCYPCEVDLIPFQALGKKESLKKGRGAFHEQSSRAGGDKERCVHSDGGRQTRKMDRQRPAFCRLGDLSHERIARESQPHRSEERRVGKGWRGVR